MAKNAGKIFEEDFKKSCQKDKLFIHRVRDNAMSYIQTESVFTQKNDFDFLVYKMPFLWAFELKHTTYPDISIQISEDEPDKKMIKYHQIEGLRKAAVHDGVYAGFILSFQNKVSQSERTFYISIENFDRFLNETGKKSINMIDIARYGGVFVKQNLVRTHYHYCINDLLTEYCKVEIE